MTLLDRLAQRYGTRPSVLLAVEDAERGLLIDLLCAIHGGCKDTEEREEIERKHNQPKPPWE